MKTKHFFFLAVVFLGFWSCKPLTQPTPQIQAPTTSPFIALKSGNYWIYKEYEQDSSGTMVGNNIQWDSVYISHDTIINNKPYFIMHEKSAIYPVRDSSGYLVGLGGQVLFASDHFDSFLVEGDSLYADANQTQLIATVNTKTVNKDIPLTVAAGTFKSRTYRYYIQFIPNLGYYQNREWDVIYGEGVGKIKELYFYAGSPNTMVKELVRYHIN